MTGQSLCGTNGITFVNVQLCGWDISEDIYFEEIHSYSTSEPGRFFRRLQYLNVWLLVLGGGLTSNQKKGVAEFV